METKEQQFNQEQNRTYRAIDRLEETKTKLREENLNLQLQNSILLNTMKEIAVKYPEKQTAKQAKLLCQYLIAKAQEAVRKVKPEPEETLNPLFQDIVNTFLNSNKP